jgi:putative ABC transport system permease protein
VKSLDRKLFRDLSRLRGQVITIALVVACGIAGYITLRGTYASLKASQAAYYEANRFAEVFATLRRAPKAVAEQVRDIPGIAQVETRVVHAVQLPLPDRAEPARGQVISLPSHGGQKLNALYLLRGRLVEPLNDKEVVINDGFSKANGIEVGDELPAVINGRFRSLEVVGVAMSPEFLMTVPPGEMMPDDRRFGLLWMDGESVAAAFRMEGAFNDLTAKLQPGADVDTIVDRLDRLFEPFGALSVVDRSKQLSHFALTGELDQLKNFAAFVPLIFLSVAAFLLNVVLSRLVHLQRPEIATLKAVGYSGLAIGMHYLKLVTVIVAIGAALGLGLGIWLGRMLTELYAAFFHFPVLIYSLDAELLLTGTIVSFVAAAAGALVAVRNVIKLPPAEAMRPPAPLSYKPGILERLGVGKLLSQSGLMVLRELSRRPWRVALSALGIAAAIGVMVVGRFNADSFDYMIYTLMHEEQPAALTVDFIEPVPESSRRVLKQIPGVHDVEGMRMVAVRFRNGAVWRDSVLSGIDERTDLRRVINRKGEEYRLPGRGVVLSAKLAEILDIKVGDTVRAEVRFGERRKGDLLVAGVIDDLFGLQGYMKVEALHAFLGQEASMTRAYMSIDENNLDDIQRRLKEMPRVATVTHMQSIIDRWQAQSGNMILVFTLIMTLFAMTIAIGVVYNNARVALSMRIRDLSSLRVLGFTRGEISSILLSELAVQVLLAIPIGLAFGYWWCLGIAGTIDPETYRLPIVISGKTYGFATSVALLSGLASALLVRRKLDRLDLIAVLKTRQ